MLGEETVAADVKTAIMAAADNGNFGTLPVRNVETSDQIGVCVTCVLFFLAKRYSVYLFIFFQSIFDPY